MRIRLRTRGRVRPALLVPAVVAIVLGILGMHGFDTHGVNMHGAMLHAETGTSAASVMPGHDPLAAERGDAHSTARPGTSATASGEAVGMSGLVMLCAAMLAGAAAALLSLLVRRSRLPKVWALLQPAGRVWRPEPLVLRVGTGPPSAWRFSVIRC
jgi:hypothetical protein